jgi:glycosyltransferase involved in cell wall biosynthesis
MKFSIIIPAYNVEQYINSAIDSVLKQKFNDYEVIVINDCSSDHTLEILKSYKDKIIIIDCPKNGGASKSRNLGLKKAKGEYIVFLDADDILKDEEVLSNIDKLIADDNPDIVYLGFEYKYDKRVIMPREDDKTSVDRAIMDIYPNIWSKCFNRKFIKQNNLRFNEELRYSEDTLFLFHALCLVNTYKVADFITHIYTEYRENSLTMDYDFIKNSKSIIDRFLLIARLIELLEIIPETSREALIKMIKHLAPNSINYMTQWFDNK